MSHQTFNLEWTEAMMELVELLKIEFPRNINDWPVALPEFAKIYVLYVQVYRKLEDAYDQIVHPQKRRYAWKALEACIGRLLEIKGWMVELNENKEYFNFDEILINMGIGPDGLDVVPPHFLTDDNKALLEAREEFLNAAIAMAEAGRAKEAANIAAAGKAAKDFQDRKYKQEVVAPPPPITEDEAIALIQAEERGRQSRHRVVELAKIKQMQELELEKQRAGIKLHTKDSAVDVLQRITRGFNARLQTEAICLDEMTLIHMNNFVPADLNDPRLKLQDNLERRKKLQEINRQEENDAIMASKEKIKEMEGQEMREIMQERINVWLNENQDPDTNFYPPFPKSTIGGSKDIIDPPPELWRPEDENKKKGEEKTVSKKKKKVKKGIRILEEEHDLDAIPMCPNFFGRHIKKSIESFIETWHDKDDYQNYQQNYIPEILKNTLRPLVFEEVRLEVDVDSREIFLQLKKKIAADKKEAYKTALKQAKKEGKDKEFKAKIKAEKQQARKDKIAKMKAKKEAEAKEPPPPSEKSKRQKPKRKKDLTEKFSVESLFIELVTNGIMQVCPKRTFDEYICQDWLRGIEPDPIKAWLLNNSMAQAKRLMIEYGVLPLSSEIVNENAPFIRSLLLHGAEKTGKSLLVHAACRAAGATFINLSASVIDGKYQGAKNITRMLQISFKLAKIMAPSMIFIDNVDQVFVSDKKKIKAYGFKDKPNRIKKGLMKELKALAPGEKVFLVGTTSKPQDLQGKKGPNKATANFCKFFTKRIYTPYPDYGARMLVWRGLLERHGAVLTHHFNVSTLAYLSADYSIGDMEAVCKEVLTVQRVRKAKRVLLEVEEVVNLMFKYNPIDPDLHTIAKHFGKAPQPVPGDPNDKKKGVKKADPNDGKKKK